MFDPVEAFTKQFEPVAGGYLYYPSKKSGGKLVTPTEYEQLAAGWRRVAGRGGQWKMAGVIMLAVALWVLVVEPLGLPDSATTVFIGIIVVAMLVRFYWAGLATRRLVKDRVDIAPPRTAGEAGREARAMLNWPVVCFALIASAAVFLLHLSAPQWTFSWWAWLVGSGGMLVCYLWIALKKSTDRRRR